MIENVGGGGATWIDLFRGRENVDVYVLESGRGVFFGSSAIYLHGETSARCPGGFLIVGHSLSSICDDQRLRLYRDATTDANGDRHHSYF